MDNGSANLFAIRPSKCSRVDNGLVIEYSFDTIKWYTCFASSDAIE